MAFLLQHVPVMVFVFAFGAIVGSFINVVIYRLPAGMSVVTPPSRCPTCGARLSWRENLPIVGWFLVRGRCAHCRAAISPQYMVIESFMAVLFVGLYAAFYMAGPRVGWWGAVGGDWWYYNWVFRTGPVYLAHAFLLAALVAMTVVDARTFTIPIQIPRVVTLVALAAYGLQALLPTVVVTAGQWPIPTTGWRWLAAAGGGMLGIGVALVLLRCGVFRYSFADYDEYVEEGQVFGAYPHARREMGVELLFLLPCLAGLAGGFLVGAALPAGPPPVILQALGGACLGYLVGGGLIWAVRILGTLAFGREAMGLGDVHLLGAVGAVLGWVDPLFVFLLAPFFGLAWAVLSMGLASVFRRVRRELPFGPHLAVATLVVLLCRPAINWVQSWYLPWLPPPGLVQPTTTPAPAAAPGGGTTPP
ncbi:MAG: prepilin peptidase [Planctomycetota bacterium]|jgi:leader peptidase (prepilin peptidase)/N-methyltransferase